MANRLKDEKSSYLKQHENNPVDWYPYGAEALKKAKEEDKPIFLSIGYSSCHWCHVMEKESFENDTVAKLMNDHFVSIKIDREERPDIDAIYIATPPDSHKFYALKVAKAGKPCCIEKPLTPSYKDYFNSHQTYY